MCEEVGKGRARLFVSTGKRGKERGVGLRRGAGTKDEAGAGCNVVRRGREGSREEEVLGV